MCAHVHNCTGMWGAVGAHFSVFMPAWDYMRKLRKGLKNCFPLGLFYRLLQEYLDYNPDPPTPLGCTLSLEQYNFHSMLVLGEEQELVSLQVSPGGGTQRMKREILPPHSQRDGHKPSCVFYTYRTYLSDHAKKYISACQILY